MAEYKYSQLQSVAVGMVEETVTLNMKGMGQGEQRSFSFETEQKEDIASLIASYSPAHGNWQRVGEAKTKMVSRTFSVHYDSCLACTSCNHVLVELGCLSQYYLLLQYSYLL